jgi:predicted ATP-grasp superfamily ATP-dependent carboligase
MSSINKEHITRNVLVYPGGTEIGLEIARSLKYCKEVKLFSAGLSGTPADFFFESHDYVETVNQANWFNQITNLINSKNITHIFPAHDDVILALVENKKLLNANIVSSCLETCRISRSKSETIRHLKGKIPVPHVFKDISEVDRFPIFVKPDRGQGSRGARLVRSRKELESALESDASLIAQEFIPGDEFTVDCFSDRERGVLYSAGRVRRKVTSGIASSSHFLNDPRFKEYAKKIQSVLPFHGAWFFQVKSTIDGELKLLEVAPRIAGTSGLSRIAGVNLPLLSLYESDGIEVSIPACLEGVSVERTLSPVYGHEIEYEALYLDYDDTLLFGGTLNTLLIKLAYQCINKKKPVVLVTRHAGDIQESLKAHRLQGLFDRVVHLKDGESKRKSIQHAKAVFVDDSFRELEDLRQHPGVVPLHVSSVELIMDQNEN